MKDNECTGSMLFQRMTGIQHSNRIASEKSVAITEMYEMQQMTV